MTKPFEETTQEETLANEILALIGQFKWSSGGVNAWGAIVSLSMAMRHITEWFGPEEDMRE